MKLTGEEFLQTVFRIADRPTVDDDNGQWLGQSKSPPDAVVRGRGRQRLAEVGRRLAGGWQLS